MNVPNSFSLAFFYAAWLAIININNTLPGQLSLFAGSANILTGSTKTIMTTDESLFQQVPLDTSEKTACSPADPGTDWRGVVIRAPSHIVLPEKTSEYSVLVVPICGLYLIDAASTFRHPGPKMLIVSDDTSGKIYKEPIVKRVPEPTIPPPPSRPINPSTKAAFGNYFNVNVAAYVTLPMLPARYRVKIEYAGHQSNEVIIAVVERP